jgi:prophage regulatory protein
MSPPLNRIIRQTDLPQFCGLKKTQIDHLIREGRFPRPVKLSTRRKGWLESEVAAWQADRIAKRDSEGP